MNQPDNALDLWNKEHNKERNSRILGELIGTTGAMAPAVSVLGTSVLPLLAVGSVGFWAGQRAVKEYGRAGTATRNKIGEVLDPSYTKARGFVDRHSTGAVADILKAPINIADWTSKEVPAGALGLANAATLGVVPLEHRLIKETFKATSFNAVTDRKDPKYNSIKNQAKRALGVVATGTIGLPIANVVAGMDAFNNLVNFVIGSDTPIGKLADKWNKYDVSEPFKGTEFDKFGGTLERLTKGLDNFSRKLSGAGDPKAA